MPIARLGSGQTENKTRVFLLSSPERQKWSHTQPVRAATVVGTSRASYPKAELQSTSKAKTEHQYET